MGMKPERDQAKPPPSPETLLPILLLLVADAANTLLKWWADHVVRKTTKQ
jgi:hypothetical protein